MSATPFAKTAVTPARKKAWLLSSDETIKIGYFRAVLTAISGKDPSSFRPLRESDSADFIELSKGSNSLFIWSIPGPFIMPEYATAYFRDVDTLIVPTRGVEAAEFAKTLSFLIRQKGWIQCEKIVLLDLNLPSVPAGSLDLEAAFNSARVDGRPTATEQLEHAGYQVQGRVIDNFNNLRGFVDFVHGVVEPAEEADTTAPEGGGAGSAPTP